MVDAGYPTPMGYLGPYRRERYHLPEFRIKPAFENDNETFNFYHSSLRCTIERTFGVWKNRFEILHKMRKYKFSTYVLLVFNTTLSEGIVNLTLILKKLKKMEV